jgi:hypothetical protein
MDLLQHGEGLAAHRDESVKSDERDVTRSKARPRGPLTGSARLRGLALIVFTPSLIATDEFRSASRSHRCAARAATRGRHHMTTDEEDSVAQR